MFQKNFDLLIKHHINEGIYEKAVNLFIDKKILSNVKFKSFKKEEVMNLSKISLIFLFLYLKVSQFINLINAFFFKGLL